jgi:bifunctional DNA-binding transcriptional regulator/antitoxin component of YhaV-PrlF toxin-antitoxin module
LSESSFHDFMAAKHFAQAKVSPRTQIALPESVKKKLGGVNVGDFILFFEEGDRVYISKGIIKPA